MLDRARIYATDMDADVLARARAGAFALDKVRDYTRNYLAAGGGEAFSDYYAVDRRAGRLRRRAAARRSSSPSTTSRPTTRSTSSTLILCRNVLIYFGRELQDRVLRAVRREPAAPRRARARPQGDAARDRDRGPLRAVRWKLRGSTGGHDGCELIVIGASWGGLHAVGEILAGLPGDFGVTVLVVQHRAEDAEDLLAGLLDRRGPLPVREVEDKQPLHAGRRAGRARRLPRAGRARPLRAVHRRPGPLQPAVDRRRARDGRRRARPGADRRRADRRQRGRRRGPRARCGAAAAWRSCRTPRPRSSRRCPRRRCAAAPRRSSPSSRRSPRCSCGSPPTGTEAPMTRQPAVLLVDDREENLIALRAVLEPLPCRLVSVTLRARRR